MRKFQDEISSDEEDENEDRRDKRTLSLVDKLRIKRDKEKQKRAEKLRMHLEEIDKYKEEVECVSGKCQEIQNSLRERENKYDLLSEEFKSLQKNFSAYKESREQVGLCFLKILFLIRLKARLKARSTKSEYEKVVHIYIDRLNILGKASVCVFDQNI